MAFGSVPTPPAGESEVGSGDRHRSRELRDLTLASDERLSWASSASASSDFGGGWAASQAAGPPKVFPRYGDHSGAWAQAGRRVGVVTLDLSFVPEGRSAVGVLVLETLGPGAVFAITAGPDPDAELLFYRPAKRLGRGARALYVELEERRELSDLRLWLDTNAGPAAYNEIDAVALVHEPLGLRGSTASSSPRADGGVAMANVYEMFWDCEWCDATKLLGKTHRSCPQCGAPQDPARRYFPPESDKVPVANHIYFGRDLICDHCQTPNSAAANHCVGCGAPIGDGDSEAALIEWQARRDKQDAALRRRGKLRAIKNSAFFRTRRGRILSAIGAIVLLGVLATLVTLFWTRGATLDVVGHRWERAIAIERFSAVSEGTWCSGMPSDAYGVSRSTRQSGTNQIPDGETCSTVNVDNGDGTYRQETQCQTRYRSEPVYDEWCDYTVNRWVHDYYETASGTSRSPPPYWPATSTSGCASLGCTREGGARAAYVLQYHEEGVDDPELFECDFDQERWAATELGSLWRGRIRVITGGLVCRTVKAPR